MKVLILVSSLLAAASAGWLPSLSFHHVTPQHVPVIHNGVPVETPEVQHAKQAHFSALAKEVAHPEYQHVAEPEYHHHYSVPQSVPVETPEVQHAKQAHFSALAKAVAHPEYQHVEEPEYHNHYSVPLTVPVETPEVQHAKQAHFSALAKAVAHPEYQHVEEPEYHHHYAVPQTVHYTAPASYAVQPISHHQQIATSYSSQHIAPAYETSHVIPAIGHDGKPIDTPEVEAAKAHHFSAVQKALSKVATHGHQIHYHHKRDAHWALEQHIPVINHHGVPEDTAEVKLARHEHQAAHESAHSGTFGYGIHQAHYPVYGTHDYHIPKFDHKGFQLDTAEVEHAKAAHFAAHQEANARLAHHGYASHWAAGSDSGHYY